MKPRYRTLLTLLLAHAAGSYCGYIPVVVLKFLHPQLHLNGLWFFVPLAPIFTLCALVAITISEFPHFNDQLPQVWVCYTAAFLFVCWLRRKHSPAIMRWALLPAVFTVLVAGVWLPMGIDEWTPWGSPLLGKPAPDFTLATLDGLDHKLSQERGKVVLLDFWGTWCSPCRTELKRLINPLANDVNLRQRGLSIWTIDEADNPQIVRKFLNDNNYHFPVLVDNSRAKIYRSYFVPGEPVIFVISRDGIVLNAFADSDAATEKLVRDQIETALN